MTLVPSHTIHVVVVAFFYLNSLFHCLLKLNENYDKGKKAKKLKKKNNCSIHNKHQF